MSTVIENRLWSDILHAVEKRLNRQSFETWFRPIQFEGCDDSEQILHLRAPNQVVKDWVSSNYSEVLDESLEELNLAEYHVDWMVEDEEARRSETLEEGRDVGTYSLGETTTTNGKNKSSSLFTLLEAAQSDGLTPAATTFVDIEPIELSLNPKYTFQTFVVGSCNQFAHAASLAVAEAPGKTYNPLYIYGGVGLGKTHLMHAAGHAIKERNRHLRLSYISAEKFMNELINAIRYDKAQTFREKYRSIDVLLMDDIQFMAGKERTQEEFFHTFNALYDGQKQIVITSDCPPREIPTLEERLHSRFEWGLIADMEPPDLETKVAILKRKADLDGVQLPDDVAFFIASKVKSNIRELEGSLVRLVAISSLRGLPISKMLAQDAIRNIAEDDQPAGITIDQIQQAVAAHYRLRVDELTSKSNTRQIAVPRQVAMYLCKRLTKHSFPEIGRGFGGKHHTTVIHSVEKIEALVLKDQNFHRVVSDLMDNLCK
ncbi:MAG TPA: chromosomal replication initiator protein DnaA [Pyrinomonadaceae bacterium]|jgi:chromosomal replication initiator protein|nr:chromosomal replication initiator protein DnaA [Pyrinomonadaceae bacterium]